MGLILPGMELAGDFQTERGGLAVHTVESHGGESEQHAHDHQDAEQFDRHGLNSLAESLHRVTPLGCLASWRELRHAARQPAKEYRTAAPNLCNDGL
jgi:hypothetical protein